MTTNQGFTHLHVHTEYSLLDGAARIGELLDAAKNLGMNSLAITDHGTMYGVINFYKEAVKRGIKPIIGCEFYVAPYSCLDRDKVEDANPYHLVLLAKNNNGYRNLVKLASAASIEGFYHRPRIDRGLLEEYCSDLIALSGCVRGEIPRAILRGENDLAEEVAAEYIDMFGWDNFFLEVQNHGLENEFKVREVLKRFSTELGLKLVATNDSHYIRREDAEFHDLLVCVKTGKKIDDEQRLKFPCDEYYLKSPAQMRDLFADMPEACDNTLRIAEECNVTFEFGKFQMPYFPLPEKYVDDADYLRDLCNEKLPARYDEVTDEVRTRLNHELEIIHGMGYDGYFLIVQENSRRTRKRLGGGKSRCLRVGNYRTRPAQVRSPL